MRQRPPFERLTRRTVHISQQQPTADAVCHSAGGCVWTHQQMQLSVTALFVTRIAPGLGHMWGLRFRPPTFCSTNARPHGLHLPRVGVLMYLHFPYWLVVALSKFVPLGVSLNPNPLPQSSFTPLT